MSRRLYSETEMRILASNKNVLSVTEKTVQYLPNFKVKAVHENLSGKAPMKIFLEAGFTLEIIGKNQPKECLKRWRKTYRTYGDEGLLRDNRGKDPSGRPSNKVLSTKEKLSKAEARVKYLEAELEFLKKLDALERKVKK